MSKLFFLLALLLSPLALAQPKALCVKDLRLPSDYKPIMRLRASLSEDEHLCSGFMIGKACALTAGHCQKSLNFAEFRVPDGDDFVIKASDEEDIYQIDTDFIVKKTGRAGGDFTVFKLEKNKLTGLYPGEVYGYLELFYHTPKTSEEIMIAGYGSQYTNAKRYHSQKFSEGEVLKTYYRRGLPFIPTLHSVTYNAGSTGGDSGAPIFLKATGQVIGIHNAGSCSYGNHLQNFGTLLDKQKDLELAIKKCLNSE
ncbi:MAG: trypsin-like serine protease [Bacteriovoracaceae bacterium]|jgi:V8-like Glu-specific endopeptidase|nr:hypothetical protein [Halobacteriovoraceae bacterium]MDP7321559.1 trypsin-like serine protease [Bacteriovoracaceae bacterium]